MTMPFYVPPEQLMQDRAEFARKGIAKGRSILAVEYDTGILIVAENPSRALNKIGEVYDKIAFAGVGKYNEFEALRVAGIRHADVKGFNYGREDVNAKGLANAYAQTLGAVFTNQPKPYEIELLVAEVGGEPDQNRLFRIRYDGTLGDEQDFCAIGGQEEELTEVLRERFTADLSLSDAVKMAIGAFESVEERTIPSNEWEAAVVDRSNGRRSFRRLTSDEVDAARN